MANEGDYEKQRNIQNNSNNIRNAADVAIASKNPYAMAVGGAIKAADKITGGRSTEKLGKSLNTANKISPGGKKIQKLSNQLSESGVSNKIGQAASIKNRVGSNGNNYLNTNEKSNTANNTQSDTTSSDNFSGEPNNAWSDTTSSDNFSGESKADKNELFGKFSMKTKITIFGIVGFLLFIIFFIVIIFAPVGMVLGIIDVGDSSSSSNSYAYSDYVSTTDNTSYWWPIGSDETVIIDGKIFAFGDPISSGISSKFGYRKHPITGVIEFHNGIDIVPIGSYGLGTINIVAIKDGTVIYPGEGNPTNCPYSTAESSCGGGFGNYVIIQHSDGLISLYGHIHENTVTVKNGDVVKQGQVIGKMGSSGMSTGMHLHFTIKSGGNAVNPIEYVSDYNSRPGLVKKKNSNVTEELQ